MEKNSSSACAFGSHIENRSKGSCASMYQRLEPASQRAPSACASEYSSGGTKRYVGSIMLSDGQFGHCAAPGEFWTVGAAGGGTGFSDADATREELSAAGMGTWGAALLSLRARPGLAIGGTGEPALSGSFAVFVGL